MQIIKQALRSGKGEGCIQDVLSKFLLMYRVTPHTTTGVSPSELLMGRRIRSRLDMWFPSVEKKVNEAQRKQKANRDNHKHLRVFAPEDKVLVKNFRGTEPKWLAGTVIQRDGQLSYLVRLANQVVVRRHVDHIRARDYEVLGTPPETSEEDLSMVYPSVGSTDGNVETSGSEEVRTNQPVIRRSQRTRHPPNRYGNPLLF